MVVYSATDIGKLMESGQAKTVTEAQALLQAQGFQSPSQAARGVPPFTPGHGGNTQQERPADLGNSPLLPRGNYIVQTTDPITGKVSYEFTNNPPPASEGMSAAPGARAAQSVNPFAPGYSQPNPFKDIEEGKLVTREVPPTPAQSFFRQQSDTLQNATSYVQSAGGLLSAKESDLIYYQGKPVLNLAFIKGAAQGVMFIPSSIFWLGGEAGIIASGMRYYPAETKEALKVAALSVADTEAWKALGTAYVADFSTSFKANTPYVAGQIAGNLLAIYAMNEAFKPAIKEEGIKSGYDISPARKFETGEIGGVKIGINLETPEGFKFNIGDIYSSEGKPIFSNTFTLVKEVGTPQPYLSTPPSLIDKLKSVATGEPLPVEKRYLEFKVPGMDVEQVLTNNPAVQQWQNTRLVFQENYFNAEGDLVFTRYFARTGLGKGGGTLLEQVSSAASVNRVPVPEFNQELQRIGFESFEAVGSEEGGATLSWKNINPTIEEIKRAGASNLVEPEFMNDKAVGVKIKAATEQIDVFRKGEVLQDFQFNELVNKYQENMLKEGLNTQRFQQVSRGTSSFLSEQGFDIDKQLELLSQSSVKIAIKAAKTFRYTEPESGIWERAVRISPQSEQALSDLQLAKILNEKELRTFPKDILETEGVDIIEKSSTVTGTKVQNLPLQSFKFTVTQFPESFEVSAPGLNLKPILAPPTYRAASSAKYSTRNFEINMEQTEPVTRENTRNFEINRAIERPVTQNINRIELAPMEESIPVTREIVRMRTMEVFRQRYQPRITTEEIPIPGSEFDFGRKRQKLNLFTKEQVFKKVKITSLPISDLLSLSLSEQKFGRGNFPAGPKALKAFRASIESAGVFASFPSAEQIKSNRGKWRI